MAYSFHGFIGSKEPLTLLARHYRAARLVALGQNLFVVPLGEALQQQSARGDGETADGFRFLSKELEDSAMAAAHDAALAYVEVDQWGSEGSQSAIFWEGGRRVRTIRFGQGVINTVLRALGAVGSEGLDPFDAMGFGRRRFTDEWLEA